MQNFKVLPYKPSYKDEWDKFVIGSNQQTFLFQRDFMGYHSHRFQDFSLMIYKGEKLVALLPANILGKDVYSHQGLSYGGLIFNNDLKTEDFLKIFEIVLEFLNNNRIDNLIIKELPSIYLKNPTNNSLSYLCFKTEATLIGTDMHSVIDLNFKSYSSSRKEGVKRGQKHNLRVEEFDSFDLFWEDILTPNLEFKHNVKPVHSLEEISLLKTRFPNNIRQFNIFYNDKIVGGTTIFETENVVHCQYISGNSDKNEIGSLDFLHDHLLDNIFNDKKYFSLGTSNIKPDHKVNKGLQFWKEGFGARSITQGFYKIDTANYKLLEDLYV